jgi:uncharacterized membrane protein
VRTVAVATLLVGSALWVSALVAAPLLTHQSGAMAALASTSYLAGRAVCHQQPTRSFRVGGTPMPVCARCLGLYAGVPLGFAAGLFLRPFGRKAPDDRLRTVRRALAVVALPTAATVGAEWAGLASPDNLLRAALAAPLGAVVAWVVASAVRGDIA